MTTAKDIFGANESFIKRLFFLVCLLLLATISFAGSSSPKAQQWQSVGGKIVASGTHDFNIFWHSAGNGMFWKNSEDHKFPATHSNDEVLKDVAVKMGQISVQGPGILAGFTRTKKGDAGAWLKSPKSGKIFHISSLGQQKLLQGPDGKWKWVDYVNDIDPSKPNDGFIPAGKTVTLDVWVSSSWEDGGVWWKGYSAPKGVEYEFWFFPREGGRVIGSDDQNKADSGPVAGIVKDGQVFDETTGKWLKPGDSVYFGHTLRTSHTDNANLLLAGGDSEIRMSQNTQIIPKKVIPKKASSGVFVSLGRIYTLFKSKEGNTYAIETYDSVIGVEGTQFETAYDPNTRKTTLTVWEGVVSFECKTSSAPPAKVNAGVYATMDNNCNQEAFPLSSAPDSGWANCPNSPPKQNTADRRLEPVADSHVYAYAYRNWNASNWGKYEALGAGWHPTGGEKRAYLKFDLSGVGLNHVDKATLRLLHNHTGGSNTLDLGVYRVLSPWVEGNGTYEPSTKASPNEITWLNQPSIDPRPLTTFNPGGPGLTNWVNIDITELVNAWLSGTPNDGLVLMPEGRPSGSTPESQYGFLSREYDDPDERPVLILSGSGAVAQPGAGPAGDVFNDPMNPGSGLAKNTLSCTNKDNAEKGCCCFKGRHTYRFDTRWVSNILARFDTGRRLDCKSTVKLDVDRGNGWETVKTVQANSSRDGSELAPSDVLLPINGNLAGVRISDGCVCCIDTSEITLNAASTVDLGDKNTKLLSGLWNLNQHNGYKGQLNIQQDSMGQLTGTLRWTNHPSGTVSGNLTGERVEFAVTYPGGLISSYQGTLTQNGSKIINGTVKDSSGGSATWDGTR